MEEKIIYVHWRTDNSGSLTFAMEGFDGTGQRRVGVAFCAPTDNFCKKRGRTIAKGRMKNGMLVNCDKTNEKLQYACHDVLMRLQRERRDFDHLTPESQKKAEPHVPRWIDDFVVEFMETSEL